MSSFLSHRRKAFRGGVAFDGFGNASREFDGTGDLVSIGDVLESVFIGTGVSMTIAAWIKPDGTGDGEIICSYSSGSNAQWIFRHLNSSSEIGVIVGNPTWNVRFGRQTSTSGSVGSGVWTHVAFVYTQADTGEHLKLYINGTEYVEADTELVDFASAGTFSSISNTNAPMWIGANQAASSVDFDGNLADVRIYDADIGSTEVANLASGIDYQTNLVGWWLDDDDDVLDNAGSNDGTNNGSTYDNTDAPNL